MVCVYDEVARAVAKGQLAMLEPQVRARLLYGATVVQLPARSLLPRDPDAQVIVLVLDGLLRTYIGAHDGWADPAALQPARRPSSARQSVCRHGTSGLRGHVVRRHTAALSSRLVVAANGWLRVLFEASKPQRVGTIPAVA
jgi:hypothetical protein